MSRLLLIRHGAPQAAWGGAGDDPGLSDLGHAQALEAAHALRAYGGIEVISSPMRRCLETAAPFGAWRGRAPRIEARVSEIVADEGVDDRAAWLQARFPWRDRANPRLWPSLEPRLHVWRADVLEAVSTIQEDAAVFTHFISINVIVGAAMGRGETIVCIPGHASITELEVREGRLTLVRLGAEMAVDDVR